MKIRSLFAAWMLAGCALLALSSSASASNYFYGSNVYYYANGTGHFDATYFAHNGGSGVGFDEPPSAATSDGSADAGITLAIFDGATATTYGVYGDRQFTSLVAPFVQAGGDGSAAHPYVLQSEYLAGDYDVNGVCAGNPCLKVTELAQYRSDSPDYVLQTYHVDNEGSQPVQFRLTASSDTDLAGSSEGGTGYFESSTPRAVGTVDDDRGNSVAYQEVAASPWTHWQEGVPSAISLHVQSPAGGSLDDTPGAGSPTTAEQPDKAMAVEWDDYETTGIAAGAGHDFQVYLRFHDFKALTLSDPGSVQTGPSQPVTVTATVKDQYGNAVAVAADDIHYRVSYGPDAPVDQSFLTATPTGTGTATATWTWNGDATTQAASDELEVWVDLNGDGVQDPNEPDRYQYADWFDGFELSPYYNSRIVGNTDEVYVYSYDSSGSSTSRAFKWKVTGANPQVNAADAVNGMFDCTAGCATSPIQLTGNNVGVDTIQVWEDLNGDSDYDDYGEKRTTNVSWTSGLTLSPSASRHTSGTGTWTAQAVLRNAGGTGLNGVPLYYTVTGANAQGASCAGSATVATVENQACKTTNTATISYTGEADITMPTTNAGEDTLTVWREVDGIAGNGPTSGDQVVATGNYVTTLSPDQRLTTAADDDLVRIVGSPYVLTTTLKTATGGVDGRSIPIRYEVDGVDSTDGEYLPVTNDGSGHASIPLSNPNDAEGYDDVYIYADLNDNGQQDSNEPSDYAYIDWYARVHLTGSASQYVPATDYVYAVLSHADGTPYTGTYEWWVDDGAHTTATSYSGYTSITVPSQSEGDHTIHVKFTDTDGVQENTFDAHWSSKQALTVSTDIPVVSNSRDASTGTTVHATLSLTDYDGTPAADQVVRYEIYGANDDSGKRAVQTDADGHASISWVGTNSGSDTLHAWPDYNQDGREDGSEFDVDSSTTVNFHDRVELTPADMDYYKYEGDTASVTVKFHDDLYHPLANKPLTYAITGANPIAAPTVTTDSTGTATIHWTGKEAGNDQLVVWQDDNGNGQLDPGEQASQPMTMHWYQRLDVSLSSGSVKPTNSAFTVGAYLDGLNGSAQAGAVLHWIATGASPQSGDTTATDASGFTSFQISSSAGGADTITVFLDSNGSGARDAGEPEDTVTVTWTSAITLSCGCSQTKPEGNTQAVTASLSSGTGTLYYQVYGANPVAATPYGAGPITLAGTHHGSDSLVVWADAPGGTTGVRDSNEVVNWFFMDWTPRVQIDGGDGYRVAGGSVSMIATLLDSSGNPVAASGTPLTYTITGANPSTGVVHTNSLGRATIAWTGTNSGTDTVSVTDGTYTNTKSIYWNAPPVTLSLAHNTTASAYQTNTHTVTTTISGVTIPAGGFPVHFTVTGANSASQTVQSNSSGVAQFTWTGTEDGVDTVSAYADISGTTARDSYDPAATASMTWLPLVTLSSTTTDQAIGEPHTETVTFVDNTGAPLANKTVLYQITGANATAAGTLLQARALTGGDTATRMNARTNSSGTASITWTGTNAGTDTLEAWGDANDNGAVDAGEPKATKTVTWRTATAASAPPSSGGTTPIATPSAVTPGSANDFDGVATPPPPVVAKSVNVAPVKGRVFVRLPKTKKFIELLDAEQIPVGSIVDVRKGTVALTSAQNLKGGVATANFYAGQFKIAQKRAKKPVTDLKLYGGSFRGCSKILKGKKAGVARKKKIRQLWGSGHGKFRTKGKYASAAIRGTKYDVVDYCDGTLVKVAQGKVAVQNFRTHKTKIVKARKSLFVPAKR